MLQERVGHLVKTWFLTGTLAASERADLRLGYYFRQPLRDQTQNNPWLIQILTPRTTYTALLFLCRGAGYFQVSQRIRKTLGHQGLGSHTFVAELSLTQGRGGWSSCWEHGTRPLHSFLDPASKI